MTSTDTNLIRVSHSKAVEDAKVPERFKSTFEDVLRRDYEVTYGFSDRILSMPAISIDAWESGLTKNLDNTMDTCVGIATHDKSRQFGEQFNCSNHRLLMVEFKLRCKSATSVRPPDLLRKVVHSRKLFIDEPVDKANIFIFTKTLVPAYKSTLKRYQQGNGKNDYAHWEIMSPEDFNNYIAFEEDFPFQPFDEKEEIINDISSAYRRGIESLETQLSHWMNKMVGYRNVYCNQNADHIKETVKEILGRILPTISNEDDRIYLEIEFSVFL